MRRNDKGFTLIEVLVALSILAGGIVMLTLSWSGNFMRIRKTTMLSDVSTLLERKMVETEAKYKTKQLAEIPDEEEGDFGSEHPQYKWKMKSKDLKLPDLSPLLIGQEDGADETLLSMIKQVSESLSKAIKEVRITIYVKRGPTHGGVCRHGVLHRLGPRLC